MNLSRSTAENIIKEISKVLDYDINMMDEKGEIIASTKIDRVSQFHEGAYKIIKENLPQLIVYKDGEYKGCKKGVNFPIFFREELIGAIGITGDPEETLKYGKIIKKMTEVLVLDIFDHHQKNLKEQKKMIFFHEWLNGIQSDEVEGFEDMLSEYGLSAEGPYVVAAIKPKVSIPPTDEPGLVFIILSDSIIAIANINSPQKMKIKLEHKLQMEYNDVKLFCAIGSCQNKHNDINRSYKHALKTMDRNTGKKNGMILYDEEILDIILDDIPYNQKSQYINMIFPDMDQHQKDECINFINIYCKHNGSISKIADELFIHKNTVQYKINKIKNLTGKDIRNSKDMIELYLCTKWA